MDPVLEKKLERHEELLEENNKLLKKVHRHLVVGRAVNIAYWAVIIGAALGLYWILQPFIENLLAFYSGVAQQGQNVTEFISDITGTFSGDSIAPR
jgi:hypothetical protein